MFNTLGRCRNPASRPYRLAIAALVVAGLGHWTHFRHIVHESHVPSLQT